MLFCAKTPAFFLRFHSPVNSWQTRVGHPKTSLLIIACSLLIAFSTASQAQGPLPSFVDVTSSAGLNAGQQPIGLSSFVAGGAVGDFNRDGFQDIFVPVGGGSADKLYINNGDGTFTEDAAGWGIALAHRSASACVGDFDGDGFLDLYVTSFGSAASAATGQHKLYRNNGGSSFTDIAASAGVHQTSPSSPDGYGACFGDYDLDGDLDLAVAGWSSSSQGNRLFRNNGDSTFTDVTSSAGLTSALNGISGFTVRFVDMDGDRYPELLWVGDFGTSRYFRNDGDGTFTNWTTQAGVNQAFTEMGHTVADFNRDGLLDWFVTTITDNKLYINQGDHSYTEMAVSAGVAFTGWAWGAAAVDFNHDTLIDIAVTSQSSQNFMLMNDSVNPANLMFSHQASATGFQSTTNGRGLSNFDFDEDGDQDIILFPSSQNIRLYRNDFDSSQGAWIRIFLNTQNSPTLAPDGIGSRISVQANGITLIGYIDAGSNYLCTGELSAHFGLGAATIIDSITIIWNDGREQILTDVDINQTLMISSVDTSAPQFIRADANADGALDISDPVLTLSTLFSGSPVNCEAALDANADGSVDIADPVYTLLHLFSGGTAPTAPFPSCGIDPAPSLSCNSFDGCP